MSDDAPQTDAGPLAGERLAEARRLRQITLPDIARELHLDEPKVQALEENRFEILGAPVFAKGHLRKYAEIVGVPVETVMADYGALTNADIAPPVVGEPRPRSRDINLAPWLVAVPLLLIVLAAVYWWLGRTPPSVRPAVEMPASTVRPLPARPEAAAATDVRAEEVLPTTEARAAAPVAEPSLADTAPVADNAAPRTTPSVAGQVELRLTYSGDCWTEVTDANGERLFFDLGRNGRTVSLSGSAPLRVLLGDSNNVRMTVNGEPYAITNAEFRGDTARLTVNE